MTGDFAPPRRQVDVPVGLAEAVEIALALERQAIGDAAERLEALAAAGAELARLPRRQGRRHRLLGPTYRDVLERFGVAETTARRWQAIARVSEAVRQDYLAWVRRQQREPTCAGLIRFDKVDASTPQLESAAVASSKRLIRQIEWLAHADPRWGARVLAPELVSAMQRSTSDLQRWLLGVAELIAESDELDAVEEEDTA